MAKAKANKLERFIGAVSPSWAASRAKNRHLRLAYDAATDRRFRRTLSNTGGSANEQAKDPVRVKLINKCRELERNYDLVDGAYTTMSNNICGTSFRPQALSDDPIWNEQAEALFREAFAEDKEQCFTDGTQNLHAGITRAVRSMIRDGDVLLVKTGIGEGMLRPVEADRILTPTEFRGKKNVNSGVMTDPALGRPTRYYISGKNSTTGHERMGGGGGWFEARDCLLAADKKRFNQARGIPTFAASIDTWQDITDFIRYELWGKKLAASVGLVFTIDDMGDWAEAAASAEDKEDPGGNDSLKNFANPMMMVNAQPGEGVETLDTNRPGPNFQEFVDTLVRHAGRPTGMPLELLTLNFSKSNFSNTRQAIIEARHGFEIWRENVVIPDLLAPIWQWKMDWWARPGGPLHVPGSRTGRPRNGHKHVWRFKGWTWIDALKDIMADGLAEDRGVLSPQELIAKGGGDMQETRNEIDVAIADAMTRADAINTKYPDQHVDWRFYYPNKLAPQPDAASAETKGAEQ